MTYSQLLLLPLSLTAAALAQAQELPAVTVRAKASVPVPSISGFDSTPITELPRAVTIIDSNALQNNGIHRLSEITRLDASVTDAYNAAGYWDYLTVRGFVLDNRYNYRREGLPISAETSIPLENKERIEILKGTSGIEAGTSAPGGLVNYVVKRPTDTDLRQVRLEWTSRASLLTALDLGGRFGVDQVFGYRFNAATEELRPLTHNLDGNRQLLALATDWRVQRDALLSTELEWSHKSQPSQPGFSLLGNTLPTPVDPRININNQAWSQPSVFDALTGSLRWQQRLNSNWHWSAQWGQQNLRSDDRVAFPSGCGAEGNYDRYCSNGTYDLYDFRSEDEQRRRRTAQINLSGKLQTAGIAHELSLGLTHSLVRERFGPQAYNPAGIGNIAGTLNTPAAPTPLDTNTNRDERSIELSIQDRIRWTPMLSSWLGLRTTRLSRDSIRTDGSRATHYDAMLNTPWLAFSYALLPDLNAYASYGEGIETQVVPNKSTQYTNAGVALPPLKSRQWEIGLKHPQWQLTAFRITRPVSNLDACGRLGIAQCQGAYDGEDQHTGLEASGQWRSGPWRASTSTTWLHARRQGSTIEPTTNGQAPTNVPTWVARGQLSYTPPSLPALTAQTNVSYEGSRSVLPDNSVTLPAWTRIDAALRYITQHQQTRMNWNFGVTNLFDKRYWQESPYQYGHVYLFPGQARTWRISLTADL